MFASSSTGSLSGSLTTASRVPRRGYPGPRATAIAGWIAQPQLDLQWEHHPSHFWLVLATATINVVLATLTHALAARHRDARLLMVSLAFLASAGFLGLHALATPGVLLSHPNTGFTVATPVGLMLASVFAALSVALVAGQRAAIVLRYRRVARVAPL